MRLPAIRMPGSTASRIRFERQAPSATSASAHMHLDCTRTPQIARTEATVGTTTTTTSSTTSTSSKTTSSTSTSTTSTTATRTSSTSSSGLMTFLQSRKAFLDVYKTVVSCSGSRHKYHFHSFHFNCRNLTVFLLGGWQSFVWNTGYSRGNNPYFHFKLYIADLVNY